MGAILQRIDDPRDNLEKALPDEIYFWAKSLGIKELTRDMPGILMREIMRAKGMVSIPIPERILGQPTDWRNEWSKGSAEYPQPSITAEQLLRKQWEERNPPASTKNPVAELLLDRMNIRELRRECKTRGVKMSRTDNIKTLREKLGTAK